MTTNSTGTGKYEQLLERCRSLAPVPTAVAHPCEATALAGPMLAAAQGLIVPILVGPAAKIAEVARAEGLDLGATRIVLLTNNPDKVAALRHFEIDVVAVVRLHTEVAPQNERYLATKRDRLGHDLPAVLRAKPESA